MNFKKPNWIVVSGVSAAAIVGVTGLALAGGDDGGRRLPNGISLKDRVPVTQTIDAPPSFDVIGSPIVMGDSDDSPFGAADADYTSDSPDNSAGGGVAGSNDSPDNAPDASLSWGSPDPAPAAPFTPAGSNDSPFGAADASFSADSPDAPAPAPVAPAPVDDSFDSPVYTAPPANDSFDSPAAPPPANDSFDSPADAGSFDSPNGS